MQQVQLVPPQREHIPELARICFEAFRKVSEEHGFPRDLPDLETATRLMDLLLQLPGTFGVMACLEGRVVGSNFMILTDEVGGVGPVSVDPTCQARGIGRLLMEAALDYTRRNAIPCLRLLQDSNNAVSLSLYASLGFEIREPIAVMQSAPRAGLDETIRRAEPRDLPAMEELCRRRYKISRHNECAAWLEFGFPILVREVGHRLTGYLVPGKIGHAVAESESDALALVAQIGHHISAAQEFFLCPLRNASLFQGCLRLGCRTAKVMTLMSLGAYAEPEPIWMPSIAY